MITVYDIDLLGKTTALLEFLDTLRGRFISCLQDDSGRTRETCGVLVAFSSSIHLHQLHGLVWNEVMDSEQARKSDSDGDPCFVGLLPVVGLCQILLSIRWWCGYTMVSIE